MERDTRDGPVNNGHGDPLTSEQRRKYPADGGLKEPVRPFEQTFNAYEMFADSAKKAERAARQHDLLVFMGRFQPFHMGHKAVVDKALSMSKHVLILIGGEGKARSPRNPWTYGERHAMIYDCYNDEIATGQLHIAPIRDITYNDDAWLEQVQTVVNKKARSIFALDAGWSALGLADLKIGLIGCKKDHTSYYLDLFPQWKDNSVDVHFVNPLNATDIRKMLFENRCNEHEMVGNVLPRPVAHMLFTEAMGFESVDVKAAMVEEYHYYVDYKKRFPPIVVTLSNGDTFTTEWQHHCADAVVVQSGHILLIQRRNNPGKNLWALPGGFKNPNENLLTCSLRELREETKLKVPTPVLEGSIAGEMDADNPHRSERGVVISKVFLYKLKAGDLPKVKGTDDAIKAKWVPLSELREDNMFEDHFHLVNKLVGV